VVWLRAGIRCGVGGGAEKVIYLKVKASGIGLRMELA
jgi:hypothetical protein